LHRPLRNFSCVLTRACFYSPFFLIRRLTVENRVCNWLNMPYRNCNVVEFQRGETKIRLQLFFLNLIKRFVINGNWRVKVTKEHIDAFVKDCSADANHADYCDIEPVSHLLK
jgi:hypothetical protein